MSTNYMRNKKPRGANSGSRRGSARPIPDKSVLQDGIYINERFIYTITSLIGCTAQVKVRNGKVFEGIIKTASPKFHVVLEKAHVVDLSAENGSLLPSRDQIIQTIIFERNDIVTVTFVDVNLDFAVTDSFTDAAISNKCNGQSREKELQPWEADALDGDALEEIDDTKIDESGWDVNDMFQTNADKFNIKSDYDPSLSQYTTPLTKVDSDEYRQREVFAQQLANEIERGKDSKSRTDLENGDEEMAFSAVLRPGDGQAADSSPANLQRIASPSSNAQPSGGKYVAPHMRQNMSKTVTPIVASSVAQSVSATAITGPQLVTPGATASSPMGPSSTAAVVTPKPVADGSMDTTQFDGRVNGNDDLIERLPADMSSHAPVPLPQRGGFVKHDSSATITSVAPVQQPTTPLQALPSQQLKPNTSKTLEELKTFQANFKLSSDSEGQERKQSVTSAPAVPQQTPGMHVAVAQLPVGVPMSGDVLASVQQQQQALPVLMMVQPPQNAPPQQVVDQSHHQAGVLAVTDKISVSSLPPQSGPAVQLSQSHAGQQQPQARVSPGEQSDSNAEVIKKSTLNPFAKEFNPTAKPVSVPVMPSSTPPRPVSVPPSPVSTYPTPVAHTAPVQAMYPSHQQVYVPVAAQSQGPRFNTSAQNKRVTVSARGTGTGEISQAQQATVMAGAPLITAQPMAQIPIGQGIFPQQFIPLHATASQTHPGYSPFQVPMVMRPIMPVGQHDQNVTVFTSTGAVYLPVHLSHPPHGLPGPGSQMASQQQQNPGNSAPHSVQQPPASGHQTPTPSQLPQYSIQPVGVLQPTASGTPQPVPPTGPAHAAAAAYHQVAIQHQAGQVLQHQMVMQQQQQSQQQGGNANAGQPGGPAPQSPQIVYSSLPLHYAPHQGIVTYVPAVASASQASAQGQQQGHGMNVPPPQQSASQSAGQPSGSMVGSQHALQPAHLMMTPHQQQAAAGSSQHSVHAAGTATSMPPPPAGPGGAVATQMLIQGQPPQPGGPAGVNQPTPHQYVQAHQIQGPPAMAQGHIIQGGPHIMGMYAVPHHGMQQGPPQVHGYQQHGPGAQ